MSVHNKFIKSPTDLVTTHEETRAGFLSIALEKNRVGDPFVKNAFAFKAMVADTQRAEDLLLIRDVRPFLIAAAGVSDKSLTYLDENDRVIVIKELIEQFLKPAGAAYIDEAVFRYLLTKGDTVGGMMRNRIGNWGQERLVRALFSSVKITTSLAEGFGFTPMKIYCLKQQKGNSSQQMKKYGRVPLRKSITVWVKQ